MAMPKKKPLPSPATFPPTTPKAAPATYNPPLFLSSLLGDSPSVTPRQILILLILAIPFSIFGIFAFRILAKSSDFIQSSDSVICRGVCFISPPKHTNTHNPNNDFASCAPRDPMSVLYLRVPKAASTRFMTVVGRLRAKKGFMEEEFPDYREAVMGSSEGSEVRRHETSQLNNQTLLLMPTTPPPMCLTALVAALGPQETRDEPATFNKILQRCHGQGRHTCQRASGEGWLSVVVAEQL